MCGLERRILVLLHESPKALSLAEIVLALGNDGVRDSLDELEKRELVDWYDGDVFLPSWEGRALVVKWEK